MGSNVEGMILHFIMRLEIAFISDMLCPKELTSLGEKLPPRMLKSTHFTSNEQQDRV